MGETDGFYTLKGYQIHAEAGLTTAMEDYLEMICRITRENGSVHVGDLSRMLHVKPSSATKMIQQLKSAGYLRAEKYGLVHLTEKGLTAGDYLLFRHEVIHQFLRTLNRSQDELEQVEKIEHFLNRTTVVNLDRLTRRLKEEGGS